VSSIQIPITGIPADFVVPGAYAEILYAQGPATSASTSREVCFVMPKTSAGTWTVNTLYQVNNEQAARDGAGAGSPLHRAIRKFLKHNSDGKVWAVPYAATVGGSPATATATLTLAGTVTAAGTLSVWGAGELSQASFGASGATPTTVGDAIVASINGKEHLPFTASNASGTVTFTARIAGASQGTATLANVRFHVDVTAGTGLTATLGGAFLGTATAGADGTTTEATNLAAALAIIANTRKYYIGVSVFDATGIGSVKTHISTKSEPKRGLRSVGVAAYQGTLANGITLAVGRNYERLQIVWQPNSEHDMAELVGAILAIRQKEEQKFSAANLNMYPLNDIILPAFSPADYPSADDLSDAILGGLAPIASTQTATVLVQSTTTRSKNAGGTVNDGRARKTMRVSVTDEFVDQELIEYALKFSGKKLRADELLADGISPNPNQTLPANTVTPQSFKPHIRNRMKAFYDAGKIEDLAGSLASIRVNKVGGRLECGFDLDAAEDLDQTTLRVAEVSEG
jgi:phage tail sheath gpL-like